MNLSRSDAEDLIAGLKEKEIALGRAPETWYLYENHVYGAARVAETVALQITGMDAERLYVAALLHDISRTEENRRQRFHGILGYEKLVRRDPEAARSSLLHMFPWNRIPPFAKCSGLFFGNRQDYDFVNSYIRNTAVTDSDLLVQLSDSLANKDGIVTLEQRAQEYALRHGVEIPAEMLETSYRLKAYFEHKIGRDLYDLLMTLPRSV